MVLALRRKEREPSTMEPDMIMWDTQAGSHTKVEQEVNNSAVVQTVHKEQCRG
jgi:hypothetical protein